MVLHYFALFCRKMGGFSGGLLIFTKTNIIYYEIQTEHQTNTSVSEW